jgi:hypothetical protein
MIATYCVDSIGAWHSVAWLDEFNHRARGKCRHDFAFTRPPVNKRPHKDVYCCGCLGAEKREAEEKRKASSASAASPRDSSGKPGTLASVE